MNSLPSLAAEKIVFKAGLFERSLDVSDLSQYAEKHKVSSELKPFLSYLSPKEEKMLQGALEVKLLLDIGALDQLLDTAIGQEALGLVAQAISVDQTREASNQIDIKAVRAAVILGANSSRGLGIISFLEAYPTHDIVLDASKIPSVLGTLNTVLNQIPTIDNLHDSPIWKLGMKYFLIATRGQTFSSCLFGDSISAELGNTLGIDTFNFSFDGLSTVSLVEQLQSLMSNKIKCGKAVIAVGGNDAWYQMSNDSFRQKLQESISLLQKMGTQQIYLVPAFYSTVAGSKDPEVSAPVDKVVEINNIINQVGQQEKIPVLVDDVAPLYENNALKDNLSSDGDHLNADGLKIYREALEKALEK